MGGARSNRSGLIVTVWCKSGDLDLIKTPDAVSRLMDDQRPEALSVHGTMVGWRAQDQWVIKVWNGRCKFILEKQFSLLSFLTQSLTQSLSSLLVAGERRYGGPRRRHRLLRRDPPKNNRKFKLFTVNLHYFTCLFQIRNLKFKKVYQSTGSEWRFGNLFFLLFRFWPHLSLFFFRFGRFGNPHCFFSCFGSGNSSFLSFSFVCVCL
jgi:hypothetical protein